MALSIIPRSVDECWREIADDDRETFDLVERSLEAGTEGPSLGQPVRTEVGEGDENSCVAEDGGDLVEDALLQGVVEGSPRQARNDDLGGGESLFTEAFGELGCATRDDLSPRARATDFHGEGLVFLDSEETGVSRQTGEDFAGEDARAGTDFEYVERLIQRHGVAHCPCEARRGGPESTDHLRLSDEFFEKF